MIAVTDHPTVVSHQSALFLYGIQRAEPHTPTVTRPHLASGRSGLGKVYRTRCWVPNDVTEFDTWLITSPARTLVDLSGRTPLQLLGKHTDEFIRHGRMSIEDLVACAERLPKGFGRQHWKLWRVIQQRLSGFQPGDSAAESMAIRLILEAGLPCPHVSYTVDAEGVRLRLDLAWPELLIAVEIDGYAFHNTRTTFDLDHGRDLLLARAGWRVLRFTVPQLKPDLVRTLRPMMCAQTAA